MPFHMKYNGHINDISVSNLDVSAYAFSNVDGFGAQVLCYYSDLTSQNTWSELSSLGVLSSGWFTTNNRNLIPQ